MAFTTRLFSFVFLVILISFQIQVQARESQFFSKFTNNNNYVKESEFPTKEESMKYKQEEQEPTFIPQTTQTGYGLYGHETTEPSRTTTTTTYNGVHYATTPTTTTPTSFEPYTTTPTTTTPTSFEPYTTTPTTKTPTSFEPYTTIPATTTPTSFEPYTTTHSTTPTTTTPTSYEPYYTTPTTTTPTGYEAYNKNNYNNNGVNRYNGERQGMSDTRFMENGRYYYDSNSERNYDQNNQYENTKVVDQNNRYNNRGGYFGNNNGGNFYDPNSNSFEGYQNQEQFQENDEVFDP